jgi:copper homeostasis protein
VRDIVNATGCQQVHASLRGWKKDPTTALRPHVRFGSATASAEEQFDVTDGDAVRAVRAILDELAEPNDASKHGKLDNE